MENHSQFSGCRNSCNKLLRVDFLKRWNYLCYSMLLLWKAVVLELGVQGLQAYLQKFDLLKIWAKALKISVKMAPNIVWLKKAAPKVCIETHEDFFLEVTPKRGLHDLCGRKFVGKSCTKKLFRKVWENPGKILRMLKICLLLHLWWKGTSAPVAPLLKGQFGKRPRHASILRRSCAYYSTCTLCSLL